MSPGSRTVRDMSTKMHNPHAGLWTPGWKDRSCWPALNGTKPQRRCSQLKKILHRTSPHRWASAGAEAWQFVNSRPDTPSELQLQLAVYA